MAHFKSKIAVSRVIADVAKSGGSGSGGTDSEAPVKSREDFKKLKELEEERKRGLAPAVVDEDGKDINPHIPQYISDAPWYVDPQGPTLKHQRQQVAKQKSFAAVGQWYSKGVRTDAPVANKFRKGACTNCGAMTHKKADCVERPRKIGAKFKQVNFGRDEYIPSRLGSTGPNLDGGVELELSFDGKRDRWNGYNPLDHAEIIEEFNKVDEIRQELKRREVDDKLAASGTGGGGGSSDDGKDSSDDDEDKYVEQMDMPGTKMDTAERFTVRNLRIREDTAKYLRNLDLDSAHYDPKTRSMRKNPYEGSIKGAAAASSEVEFVGDNANRVSGDAIKHAQSQLFAWEAGAKGLDVQPLAEPTKLELLQHQFAEARDSFEVERKVDILERYGITSSSVKDDNGSTSQPQSVAAAAEQRRRLIYAQTEAYCEYDATGRVVCGAGAADATSGSGHRRSGTAFNAAATVLSRYAEDILTNNHTTVFGSYWICGQWAYKCCRSTIKASYCTGLVADDNVRPVITESATLDGVKSEKSSKKKKKKSKKKRKKHSEERRRRDKDSDSSISDAPFKNDDTSDDKVTEKDVDDFHRQRVLHEDPMRR